MGTLIACLTIIGVWIVLGAALVGLGRLARRLVSGPLSGWGLGDFWTGLAVAISLVMLAHLLVPVTSWLWLGLAPAAVAGLLLGERPARRPPPWVWAVLTAVVVLYVADRALQPITSTDSGLYHLPTIDWVHHYRAVPGIGNFHARLGYNTGSLMFDALTGTLVPASIAAHFSNSLLMVAVCLEVLLGVRNLVSSRLSNPVPSIVLVLAVPALLMPLHDSGAISSPSVDLPATVVTIAAAAYAARVVSTPSPDVAVLLPCVALLALLPVVRVQTAFFALFAGLVIVALVGSGRLTVAGLRRLLPRMAVLVLIVVGSWAGHGLVLTGYPAFPATALGIPVSWRVPAAYGRLEQDWISSWAREPGKTPATVLHSSAWVKPWATRILEIDEVRGMLVLLGLGVILAGAVAVHRRSRSPRTSVALLVGVAVVVALLVVAADHAERFPLLLLRVGALVALGSALVVVVRDLRPGHSDPSTLPLALVALAAAATVIAWYVLAPDPRFAAGALWLTAGVPAAAAVCWLWPRRRVLAGTALGVCVVVAGFYPLAEANSYHLLSPVHATAGGRWGMPVAPPGQVKAVIAHGVRINVPVSGDECWAGTLPCAPDPTLPWRLRQPGRLASGFVMTQSKP